MYEIYYIRNKARHILRPGTSVKLVDVKKDTTEFKINQLTEDRDEEHLNKVMRNRIYRN